MPEQKIQLGDREHVLVPQGIGRIRRKVNQIFKALGGDLEVTEVTDELYDVLRVFIPDVAPFWQMLGYASEDVYTEATAHAEAERQARADHAPLQAEWEKEWIVEVDGVEVLKDGAPDPPKLVLPDPFEEPESPGHAAATVDSPSPTPTGPQLEDALDAIYKVNGGERLVRLLGKVIDPSLVRAKISTEILRFNLGGSTILPAPNGALGSTTSTTQRPTSAPSADTQSPDSSTSSTPTEPEPVAS